MYVDNSSRKTINIFDTDLNPNEKREFLFSDTVVDVKMFTNTEEIFASKLPTDVNIKITDNNINIDKHLEFEYFTQPTNDFNWFLFFEMIIAVVAVSFIFYITKKGQK
jgi:hypothetical protein